MNNNKTLTISEMVNVFFRKGSASFLEFGDIEICQHCENQGRLYGILYYRHTGQKTAIDRSNDAIITGGFITYMASSVVMLFLMLSLSSILRREAPTLSSQTYNNSYLGQNLEKEVTANSCRNSHLFLLSL